MNKIFLMILLASPSAFAQTMYKCPSPTPGAPPIFQQAPCTPQGGGEAVTVKSIPAGVDSSEATARMQAYSASLRAAREEQEKENRSQSPSLDDHIEIVRKEELARDCYAMGKRIHWIRKKESEGVHLKQNSMTNDDSKEAIADYRRKCGAWND